MEKLRESDKNLLGNMGYRKYLAQHGADHFVIDEDNVKHEERFAGIWILMTNMSSPAPDIAWHYKELERCLMGRNQSFEWQDIKRDLTALQQIDVAMNDEPMTLRIELRGCFNEVLKAAGVAVPQRVQFK